MAVKDRASAREAFKVLRTEELFENTTPEASTGAQTIQMLSLIDLYPFKDHPFRQYNESKMEELVKSVLHHGVDTPIIVRKNKDGEGYEIICGHNRVEAAKRAMLPDIPAIVRDLDDDEAMFVMTDSNLQQREKLYPLEKAFAYKMMSEALLRKAGRNGGLVDPQLKNRKTKDIIAEHFGESASQVLRHIRLTYLTKELQEYVDDASIGLYPAVALSYLQPKEQDFVREVIEREDTFPSTSQAIHMRNLSEKGELDFSAIKAILSQPKPQQAQIVLKSERISKFFPKDYTPQQMETFIYKLLEQYHLKHHSQEPGRE